MSTAVHKYTCGSCRRGYQRKIYYNRHVAICELMCKSVKERRLENEEEDDTPNVRVLYDVILELVNKMSQMEQKMNELTKWADLKKKKINIVDWLNEQQRKGGVGGGVDGAGVISLDKFISQIAVERKHLEYLFQHDYTSGIVNVLQEMLPLEHDKNNINANNTIKAFDQKTNILFAYDNDVWAVLPQLKLQQIVNLVVKKLLDEFIKWQNENVDRMENDDFAIKYSSNVKKMMGGGLEREQVYLKVKLDLYKYLKIHVKNITEYQFI